MLLSNKEWVLKNAKPLKYGRFILGGLSLLCLIVSFYGDLQKLQVYEKITGLKNQKIHRKIVTNNDIKKPDLRKYELISKVDNNLTLFKLGFAFGSLVFISGFIFIDNELGDDEELLDYKEIKSSEAAKMDIDTEIAVKHKVKEEKVTVQALNIVEELMQNPTFKALKLKDRDSMEAVENDENDENENENENEDNGDINNIWDSIPTDTNQKDYLTNAEVKEIYQMFRGGMKLTEAFPKVIPQYNPTNVNWEDIKQEFLLKVKEIKKNENS